MKKVILAIFVLSLTLVSCTDNTAEHEELQNQIQNIDKENSTTVDGGDDDGNDGNDNGEE